MPVGASVFVDTNVLIYADDHADAAKRQQARAWLAVLWQRRLGQVSTQVLNEYYVNVTRKLKPPMAMGDARATVRRLQLWQPWQIDHATVESAWGIEARFGFSFWDALILAAAVQTGCVYVLSEDMQHDQLVDSVRILNPFKVGPERLDQASP